MKFAEWINDEIKKRGWSRREAAKRASISPSMLDKVITGYAQPGLVFYRGIARALKIPLVEILIQAGELNDSFGQDNQQEFIFRQFFSQMDEDDREDIIAIMRAKIERKEDRVKKRG